MFPSAINIPVVTVIWSWRNEAGFRPTTWRSAFARSASARLPPTVSDIEHIESQSLPGISVIKFYFQPTAKVEAGGSPAHVDHADADQGVSGGYDATPDHPVQCIQRCRRGFCNWAWAAKGFRAKLSCTTPERMSSVDAACHDPGRAAIATPVWRQAAPDHGGLGHSGAAVQGSVANGREQRHLTPELDSLPSSTAKLKVAGEYNVLLNGSPNAVDALNNLPIKQVNGAMVFIRDVAHVHDGYAVQTNIVRTNGVRSSLLTVLKSGDASTLSVVGRVKAAMPKIMTTLPPSMTVTQLFDQSIFVRASVEVRCSRWQVSRLVSPPP